jgi:hypothetical protein
LEIKIIKIQEEKMKKFWVVLLALGLVLAFSMTASAAVTFNSSGSYFIRGFYDDNRLLDDCKDSNTAYGQRLRMQPVLGITDGVSLTARFDAVEKVWGTAYSSSTPETNISFDRIYVTFKSPFSDGTFDVGYMSCGTFGTLFQDQEGDGARIKYTHPIKKAKFILVTQKNTENDIASATQEDKDSDSYGLLGFYNWEKSEAGFMIYYTDDRTNRVGAPAASYSTQRTYFPVYFKSTIDDLYLEGEASYYWGYDKKYDEASGTDVKRSGWAAYLYGKYNIKKAYVGAQVGFVSGDDPSTTKNEAGFDKNKNWNPCLILFEEWLTTYEGNLGSSATVGDSLTNGWLAQLFGGYNITDKLSVWGGLAYAKADKVAAGQDKEYGTEADVALIYQINPNLSYLVGVGYLLAGDYFKGTSATEIKDDFVVVNKLELSWK